MSNKVHIYIYIYKCILVADRVLLHNQFPKQFSFHTLNLPYNPKTPDPGLTPNPKAWFIAQKLWGKANLGTSQRVYQKHYEKFNIWAGFESNPIAKKLTSKIKYI